MKEKFLFSFIFRILLLLYFFSLSTLTLAEPPIQVYYWKSTDVETPSQSELEEFEDIMVEVQSFFASEMDVYGFGEKTFAFDEIEVIEGKRTLSYYTISQRRFVNESSLIEEGFDNQIFVLFFGEAEYIDGSLGVAQFLCEDNPNEQKELRYCNNLVVIPTVRRHLIRPLVAHEIGHAFGLDHTSELWITDRIDKDRLDVMSKPMPVIRGITMTLDLFAFSEKDATILQSGGRLSVQDSEDSNQDMNQEINADINGDGYVDLYDVMIVKSGMQNSISYDTDVNNDGVTNEVDLLIVKAKAVEAIIAAAPRKRKVKITTLGAIKTQ
ncbi:MAG: dockerin type I domain-containing protein [Candidatus Poribacteria bacterium]|nr:dockerin type I domain-containing protein [Candidatus Poribacteria bacterium]